MPLQPGVVLGPGLLRLPPGILEGPSDPLPLLGRDHHHLAGSDFLLRSLACTQEDAVMKFFVGFLNPKDIVTDFSRMIQSYSIR